MDVQYGHAARIFSTDMQHGHTACTISTNKQQRHATWTSSMDKQHGLAGLYFKDMQNGHEAWDEAWA
jgi:hypothetical protein